MHVETTAFPGFYELGLWRKIFLRLYPRAPIFWLGNGEEVVRLILTYLLIIMEITRVLFQWILSIVYTLESFVDQIFSFWRNWPYVCTWRQQYYCYIMHVVYVKKIKIYVISLDKEIHISTVVFFTLLPSDEW